MNTQNTKQLDNPQLSMEFESKPRRILRSPLAPQFRKRKLSTKAAEAYANPISSTLESPNHTSVFHSEASHISENQFALKFSLDSRSYLVEGEYRTISERSRSDDETYTAIRNINIKALYAYRDGRYTVVPMLKREILRFEHLIAQVLRNPYYNTNLNV